MPRSSEFQRLCNLADVRGWTVTIVSDHREGKQSVLSSVAVWTGRPDRSNSLFKERLYDVPLDEAARKVLAKARQLAQ